MLYIQDKVAKLGGVYLGGQVTSIEIQEAAAVYVAQDDKGKVKKMQPVGYENAKIMIEIILEDSPKQTAIEQLTSMQRLFKANGQTKAKLFSIVNEDCAVRGISQVYFKNLTTKKVVSESKRIASLELWAPKIAEVTVVKKKNTVKEIPGQDKRNKIKQINSKSPATDSRRTANGLKAARNAVK